MSCDHRQYTPREGKEYGVPQREHVIPAVFINGQLQKMPPGYVIPACFIPGATNAIQSISLVNEDTPQVALQVVTLTGTFLVPLQSVEESAGIPAPSSISPLSDSYPLAVIGASNNYAREDHRHPISKLTLPPLPSFLGTLDLNIVNQQVLVQQSTEESLHYQVQVDFNLTGNNLSALVAPNIPGFTLVDVNYSPVYDSTTVNNTPYWGTHPAARIGYNALAIRRRTGAPTPGTLLVYVGLHYVRN